MPLPRWQFCRVGYSKSKQKNFLGLGAHVPAMLRHSRTSALSLSWFLNLTSLQPLYRFIVQRFTITALPPKQITSTFVP